MLDLHYEKELLHKDFEEKIGLQMVCVEEKRTSAMGGMYN